MSLNMPLPITDSYSYQSYQRQRQLTLGDLLLENRIVFLQGEIYTGNANEVVMKLLYLQSENRRKDIHFYINSPGGSVSATLAIYDTMQMISCPVATYCVGLAASGGAVLLAMAGLIENRYAVTHFMGLDVLDAAGVRAVRARVVDDGDFISAGGVTSGLDLALHLLERSYGPRVAHAVEELFEYERRGTVWKPCGREPEEF